VDTYLDDPLTIGVAETSKTKKPGPEDGPGECWLVARINLRFKAAKFQSFKVKTNFAT
jgi:hypothetical protein